MSANEPTTNKPEPITEILPCPDAERIEALADELCELLKRHGLPHVVAYVVPKAHEDVAKISFGTVVDADMGTDDRLLKLTQADGYAIGSGVVAMVRAREFWIRQSLAGRN